jgi:hypothetical protein
MVWSKLLSSLIERGLINSVQGYRPVPELVAEVVEKLKMAADYSLLGEVMMVFF